MDISQLTANLEEINGRPLEPEEQQELVIWERGKTLLAIPPHAQIEIQQMLEGYVRQDADALLATDPANKDEVLANHAYGGVLETAQSHQIKYLAERIARR